jgi:hypothetical protein
MLERWREKAIKLDLGLQALVVKKENIVPVLEGKIAEYIRE